MARMHPCLAHTTLQQGAHTGCPQQVDEQQRAQKRAEKAAKQAARVQQVSPKSGAQTVLQCSPSNCACWVLRAGKP